MDDRAGGGGRKSGSRMRPAGSTMRPEGVGMEAPESLTLPRWQRRPRRARKGAQGDRPDGEEEGTLSRRQDKAREAPVPTSRTRQGEPEPGSERTSMAGRQTAFPKPSRT